MRQFMFLIDGCIDTQYFSHLTDCQASFPYIYINSPLNINNGYMYIDNTLRRLAPVDWQLCLVLVFDVDRHYRSVTDQQSSRIARVECKESLKKTILDL